MLSRFGEFILVALVMTGSFVPLVLSLAHGGFRDRTKGAPSEECPGCNYMRFVGCICTKCGHSGTRSRVRITDETRQVLAELARLVEAGEAPREAPRRKPRGRST